ncbi:MAG TPA: DoxX family protein [Gemmataceae bacterium]
MFKAITEDTVAPLLLRVGLAAFFMLHGRDTIAAEEDWKSKLSDPGVATSPFVLAWCEMAVGIALGVGLLTRLAALGAGALTVFLSAAIPFDFDAKGLSQLKGENGYTIVTLCACVVLVVTGAGNLSLDRAIRRWRKGY